MDSAQKDALDLEVKQLEASIADARSKGQEPRALALEARRDRVALQLEELVTSPD
jgi:pectin methylesterase-like acyl-CoA thioesterase